MSEGIENKQVQTAIAPVRTAKTTAALTDLTWKRQSRFRCPVCQQDEKQDFSLLNHIEEEHQDYFSNEIEDVVKIKQNRDARRKWASRWKIDNTSSNKNPQSGQNEVVHNIREMTLDTEVHDKAGSPMNADESPQTPASASSLPTRRRRFDRQDPRSRGQHQDLQPRGGSGRDRGNGKRKSLPTGDFDRGDNIRGTERGKVLFNPKTDNAETFHVNKVDDRRGSGTLKRKEQLLPTPQSPVSRNKQQLQQARSGGVVGGGGTGTNNNNNNNNNNNSNAQQQQQQQQQQQAALPKILKKEKTGNSEETEGHEDDADADEEETDTSLFPQPITKPISQEQLVAEVKGIYAGLVLVEAKCIEVDSRQARQHALRMDDKTKPYNFEQFQALIALHRTLLHEHHDFFLASQHPAASESLKRLADKYAMPARMWRHGIHSFLELLRHRLPHSFEHMLSFLYLAYSMIALLYETVPAFSNTWVECLGDLGRYRMAIEENDVRDRDVWTAVSRSWYSRGSDRTPSIGRLYHHQAILSRPHLLQQIFFYCKSLIVLQPFSSTRESVLSLFESLSNPHNRHRPTDESSPVNFDFSVVKVHSILFQLVGMENFNKEFEKVTDLLETRIVDLGSKFKIQGVYLAVSNIASILQYNVKTGIMRNIRFQELEARRSAQPLENQQGTKFIRKEINFLREEHATILQACNGSLSIGATSSEISFKNAINFTFTILKTILLRYDDKNCHSCVHAHLIFMFYLTELPKAMQLVMYEFPWEELSDFATCIIKTCSSEQMTRAQGEDFPSLTFSQKNTPKPIPEDYLLRGLECSEFYYPEQHFAAQLDEEERQIELPSMAGLRVEFMLWIIFYLVKIGPWLVYDEKAKTVSVSDEFVASKQKYQTRVANEDTVEKIEELDVDMNDAEPSHGDSTDEEDDVMMDPEMKQLRDTHRELERQYHNPQEEEEIKAPVKVPQLPKHELFKPNYTIVSADTNALVKIPDVFEAMIESSIWTIIISYSVWTEINGLSRSSGDVAENAKRAQSMINKAVADKKNIRIITAKGHVITNTTSNFKEQLHYGADEQSLDDVILNTARDIGNKVAPKEGYENVKPIIFVTDDKLLRIKALQKVPTMSTKEWANLLPHIENAYLPKNELFPGSPPTKYETWSGFSDYKEKPIDQREQIHRFSDTRLGGPSKVTGKVVH